MTDHMAPAATTRPERAAEGPTGTRVPGGDARGLGDNARLSPKPPPTQGRDRSPRRPFDPDTEAPELSGMVARVLRSLVRRAEAGDIDALVELGVIRQETGRAIQAAGQGLHYGPGRYTWGEVGRWLGISRQAARTKFGRGDDD